MNITQTIKYQILKPILEKNQTVWNISKLIQRSICYLKKRIHHPVWSRNQEIYINFLKSNHSKNFFFIQIGSNDGIRVDPLYEYITQYQWTGILIEPQKNEFLSLKKLYGLNENLHLENIAIADTDGFKKLYKIKSGHIKHEYEKGMATFLPEKMFASYPRNHITSETVKCMTFSRLLHKYNLDKIDLLQIDVEGYDYEIIKMINFNKIKPGLINYEHIHLSYRDKLKCKNLLKSQGYQILETECDTRAYLISI